MNRADDIANLFQSFGASTDSYLEIDSEFEYQEKPVPVRPVAVRAVHTDITETPPVAVPMISQPEQVPGNATPAPKPRVSSDPASGRPAATPLRHLLAEVAQARQAEAQARNNEALAQLLNKGQPPALKAQIIVVVSPKGGVGKSTLSSALASLVHIGGQTVAVDLDPQNALQHHLSVSPDVAGMGNASLQGENWRSLLLPGSAGSLLLPFGALNEEERNNLETYMINDTHWLARQLSRMALGSHDVVVIDTPPGRSVYLNQALAVANQVLVVTTCDAASYVILDQMEQLLAPSLERAHPAACHFVINQFDDSRPFSRDMHEVLKRRLGESLLGVVHLDHAISEALAYGKNPVEGGASQGRQDLIELAQAMSVQLLQQVTAEPSVS